MTFDKDPDAILDYKIDWAAKTNGTGLSDWLDIASGEKIVSSTWTVPSGITKKSDTFNDTTTTIWLSGGTVGSSYVLINRITTNVQDAGGNPRTDDRTITIYIQQR